jgi:hypothetical protein
MKILQAVEHLPSKKEVLSSNPSTTKNKQANKITRAKWTGGVAQAVEHLLCKCEAEFKPQFQKINK